MRIKITYDIAWSAATDAGYRHMRTHRRSKWDHEDWNAFAAEFHRLYPESRYLEDIRYGRV